MQLHSDVLEAIENNPVLKRLWVLDQAQAKLEAGDVETALNEVFDGLEEARGSLDGGAWLDLAKYARANHMLRETVYEDPMTRRAFEKPRGYAGDAVMMDYLYGIHYSVEAHEQASPMGREIYRYIQRRPAGKAVRYRREHIANLIDTMAEDGSRPEVLAIAAGHLREAELSKALAEGRVGRFVSLDADAESLREVESKAAKLGVETIHGSVRHILARKVTPGQFDFVYAAGLYDYLADNVAVALTARMFDMTKPGGLMLIPNFAPNVRDRAYMEAFMDWTLIYRDENAMTRLLAGVDAAKIESCEVYQDPSESVVYLLVRKSKD